VQALDGRAAIIIRSLASDKNRNVVFENPTGYGSRYAIVKRSRRKSHCGDFRIILVDGEPVPFSLQRSPSGGPPRHLAAGARAASRALNDGSGLCAQIGPRCAAPDDCSSGLDVLAITSLKST